MNTATFPDDTMLHVLAWRAASMPDRVTVWYEDRPLNYGTLWSGIESTAAVIHSEKIMAQDRVVVALPNGLEFFSAFYGAQLAGAIAVPVFPTHPPKRLRELVRRCGAQMLVVADDAMRIVEPELGTEIKVRSSKDFARSEGTKSLPLPSADQVAFLQYTSGSTGEPKGVMITHRSLVTNVRQMIAGMEITADERFVSWLPVYHDMGLILKTTVPMYLGAQTHLLPTKLTDIDRWLETIERIKGTFTAAPDFAWRLCLRRKLKRRYDVSSLRVALNAAEPVRAETIHGMEDAFGLTHVMTSGYGLAEATVGVSMTRPGAPPLVDPSGNVSVGRLFPGVEVEVRRDGVRCACGEVGDIHIRSTANSAGYFADKEATSALFDDSGFLASGDLGYLDSGGELFILGRKKNSIIVAGRTIAPREIEEAAEVNDTIRFAAAVGIDRKDRAGEQAVVIAEVREGVGDPLVLAEAARAIVRAVNDKVGVRPADVLLLSPHTIPLTDNGKVQHARLRQAYVDGSLARTGRILFPPARPTEMRSE